MIRLTSATVTVYHGDGVSGLNSLPKLDAALAYMDPPFFTQRVHRMSSGEEAFDDRWGCLGDYVQKVAALAQASWHHLSPGGSLVVHLDSTASHYVKIECDTRFGMGNFASEIIWRYRRWPAKTSNFQRVHDTLLRYVKPGMSPRFNQLYEPLAPSTTSKWGTRKQRAIVSEVGKRIKSSATEEASPGTPMGDVWDIGLIAPRSKERTGYPTQKPSALLDRLVISTTNEGDLVLDPCAGSGTTLSSAAANGRRGIGFDHSAAAVGVMISRFGLRAI